MTILNRVLFLLSFLFVNYRCIDAAGNLLGALGRPSQPLLPLTPFLTGNNNNYRPNNNGFNNNFGGTNNNNENFQFKPFRDSEMETSIENKLKDGTELTEDEKLAAERFPALKQLLDKLKEMNRQKELEKQKNGGNNNGGGNYGNGDVNDIDGDGEVVPGKGVSKWIRLKKRKFLFQAQPVRPEDQIVEQPEVVYYMN